MSSLHSSLLARLKLMVFAASLCGIVSVEPAKAEPQYLGDHPELVLSADQGWGELGWNVAAHQAGVPGATLAIGGKTYAKGLGHHANGSITLLLDGEYLTFEAEVGLQPCSGGGSVIFRLLVDGREAFTSGVLGPTNPPLPIRIEIAGARELRLEARDAGDGINCDMANWANARLLPSAVKATLSSAERVNIAPFGTVTLSDPSRMDGARASRIEEYRAEDVYLERPLTPGRDNMYRVVDYSNELAAVGLSWLNRRALTVVGLKFAHGDALPPLESLQVQAWFGESAWQGSWRRLEGKLEGSGDQLSFRINQGPGILQTRKIRWVFHARNPALIKQLSAYTRTRWEPARLWVESDESRKPGAPQIRVINGVLLSPNGKKARHPERLQWNGSSGLEVALLHARPSSLNSDPTMLQFQTRRGSFAVAVDDVLRQGRVYLPDFGISVARYPVVVPLKEYKQRMLAKETILAKVRRMPDQRLDQAMLKTHHPAQAEGPVMLSLACDNLKFVLERDGTLRFPSSTNLLADWLTSAGAIRPRFGALRQASTRRELEGGWLPIVLTTAEQAGVVYRQRTYVASAGQSGAGSTQLNGKSICVMEFAVTNTTAAGVDISAALDWLLDSRTKEHPESILPRRVVRLGAAGLTACTLSEKLGPLQMSWDQGVCSVAGKLPPRGEARFAVLLSNANLEQASGWDLTKLRQQVQRYWEAMLEAAAQIETPDTLLNDVIRSSQVRCLIAARSEADGRRVAPWIAAMSYGPLESEAHSVIRGMDFVGHTEFARRSLEYFIQRYNTNGFLTTGYTTFGTGWHLWTLGEHYRLTGDTKWLRSIAPELERVGEWILRQTEKTKAQKTRRERDGGSESRRDDRRCPEYGLMPPGVLADWNAFAYHYAMNAYYYAALRELGRLFDDLPPEVASADLRAQGRVFTKGAAELRENLLQAYRWTQSQSPALPLSNGAWVPHYPSQVHSPGKLADFFPGQDAGRSWCYDVELGAHQLVPTGVLPPKSLEVDRMLEHMEDVQFLADGWFDYPATMNRQDWFNLGGFSKVQPYYTRNCEVYALRNDLKPFIRSYFNTLAAMLNPEVLTFWEHFNHSGAWDKTHETGYFLHQTRTMLLQERGRELWLCPLVTSNWFGDGMVLSVSNAPTAFGPASYRVQSEVGINRIRATICPPRRQAPDQIVLCLGHPGGKAIRAVQVDGRPHRRFDAIAGRVRIKLPVRPGAINVEVLY